MSAPTARFAACAAVLMGLLACPASGLVIRDYQAARHDRFTGFPDTPQWNDSAWFDSRSFSGVGWNATDGVNKRQFALVTPRHVLSASHALPATGNVLRFLAADGTVVERTVVGSQGVPNSIGGITDLSVSTLSAPILPESGVAHLPYLNLASESAYLDTSLWIFGWQAKVGRGTVNRFSTMNQGGIADTRVMEFRYNKLLGGGDDAYAVAGDSGSPSLAMAGNHPALVGLHSAVADAGFAWVVYDSFVPHYISGIDALIAAQGYSMTPAYPEPVQLEWTAASVPAVPRQQAPGEWQLELENTAAAAAGNVRVVIEFTSGPAPDEMLAPGWIIEAAGATTRNLRRATLAAGAATTLTARWDALPDGKIEWRVSCESDGSPQQVREWELQPAPSYQAWSSGLAAAGTGDDPDGDAASNLLEYALGGDPAMASRNSLAGTPLQPELRLENGRATLRFLVRTDATLRGLSYELEFSETMAAGTWSTTLPPGLEINDQAPEPPVEGFLIREASFNAFPGRWFCRLHIALDEASVSPPPG